MLLGFLSIYENTPQKLLHLPPKSCRNFTCLVVDGRVQLEHRSHTVKVGVKGYMLTLQALMYIEEMTEPVGPLGNMLQKP